ncbi:MAG: sigma-70 family RNA polymerase sigma factor [Bacteroidaceae bacterium]|nr:sigma-70 family RNA polymerase sigma factor [Bacteroidaceae bacterium]
MLMDEQRLIVRILDGHAEDYGYFLERYGGEVFAIVSRLVPNREDAEELTQDAFVRAYSRLDSFIGRSSFSTWVCRIAYTVAVSWLRKKRIKYLSIDDHPHASDAEVDEVLDDESRLDELRHAISLLRPDEQMLLELFYFESRPLADIAYILDVEPGTIATRLHRIRRKLYSLMKHGKANK